jgi:hypothetical protein
VVAVGLHRAYGDRLMACILYDLTQGFLKLQQEKEDDMKNAEFGFSSVFEKKKNYVNLICYFYHFQALSAAFLSTLVAHLTENSSNEQNV